jgi:hypothetical protein
MATLTLVAVVWSLSDANAGDIATYLASGSPPASIYLDDGHLWFNECDLGWQYLEDVPDAYLVDCEGGHIVFVTNLGQLVAGHLNVYAPPHVYNTIEISVPPEVGNVIEASLAAPHNSDPALKVFLQNDSAELWSVSFGVASPTQWRGPCDLPTGPVTLSPSSWGRVKAQFQGGADQK